MDIQLRQRIGAAVAGSVKKGTGSERTAESSSSASSKAAPSGSEPSLQLTGLKDRMAADSGIDAARVARIAGEIQSGSYRIDPHRIAAKMIDSELALG